MSEITENAILEMTNVLSYRDKLTQNQLMRVSQDIEQLIKDNNASKTGASVSATFSIDTTGAEPVYDMEILIPIDRNISVSAPYTIKPVFKLKNAVKIRHIGNPAMMQNTADELMQYIKNKGLMPVTTGYNVTVQAPSAVDDLIVDIYVGVSDNIL